LNANEEFKSGVKQTSRDKKLARHNLTLSSNIIVGAHRDAPVVKKGGSQTAPTIGKGSARAGLLIILLQFENRAET
jgi:hypothetical protein